MTCPSNSMTTGAPSTRKSTTAVRRGCAPAEWQRRPATEAHGPAESRPVTRDVRRRHGAGRRCPTSAGRRERDRSAARRSATSRSPRWSTPCSDQGGHRPAERPCCTTARAGVTVSASCISGGTQRPRRRVGVIRVGPVVRLDRRTTPQVGLLRRQADEQQSAVMTGDDTTTMGPQHRPRGQDVTLPVVKDGADGVPAPAPVGSARRVGRGALRYDGRVRRPQIGHVDDAVLIGGVHPVVHGGQRGGVARCRVAVGPPVENRVDPELARLPVDLARDIPGSRAA